MTVQNIKAALVSLLMLALFMGIWYAATLPAAGTGPGGAVSAEQAE